jgi:hypothetical protein
VHRVIQGTGAFKALRPENDCQTQGENPRLGHQVNSKQIRHLNEAIVTELFWERRFGFARTVIKRALEVLIFLTRFPK